MFLGDELPLRRRSRLEELGDDTPTGVLLREGVVSRGMSDPLGRRWSELGEVGSRRRFRWSELGEDMSFGERLRDVLHDLRPGHILAPLLLPGVSASVDTSLFSASGTLGIGF